jgi:hypothetical protein
MVNPPASGTGLPRLVLREWVRHRTVPMLLGVAALLLIFMHSWLTLALSAELAVVALWLSIRTNRRRGMTLSNPFGHWGKRGTQ